jgi:hypothetical protein
MFGRKEKPHKVTPAPEQQPQRQPLVDPMASDQLVPLHQPGYYPKFRTLDQQNYWDAATRTLILDRVNNIPPLRFFNLEEALTMQAVAERILPQDDRTESTRIPIVPFLDARLYLNHIEGYRYEDMPSDQDAYRLALRAIDSMSRELHSEPFHALPIQVQEGILQSLHDEKPLAANYLWQQMNLKRFWTMLVADCCAIYYAHPYAWDEIGFGGPAYPRGYMRLEEGEAEPWEADEQRYDWAAPQDTLSDGSGQAPAADSSPRGQAGAH